MNCPACGTAMTEVTAGAVKVQACKGGCGGLWFDKWVLSKVDEPSESEGEALLQIEQNSSAVVDPSKRYKCPRDRDVVMLRHFWSVKRDVVVDECPKCEGIFLDPGELAQIRGAYKTDAERRNAAKEYYGEMFDEQIAEIAGKSQAKAATARRVANVFKFISPSYYIPGKQDWGSF